MSKNLPNAYDVMINEWEHSESLIRHFDTILVNLRLYGSTIYFVGLGFIFTILTASNDIPTLGRLGVASVATLIPLLFALIMQFIYAYYHKLMLFAVNRVRDIEKNINEYLKSNDIPTKIELNDYITKEKFSKFMKIPEEHWLFWIYVILSLIIAVIFLVLRILIYF